MSNTTSQTSEIDLWASRLLDAVQSMETADRIFQDLSAIPASGSAADRTAAFAKLWGGLKVAPFAAATPERAKRFLVRVGVVAPSAAATFEGVLDRLLDELGRLYEAAKPAARSVVLASDFLWVRTVEVKGVGTACVGCPQGLPADHPARCGLREEEMLMVGPMRVVVLGDRRARWYEIADVREKTLFWESERRTQAGYEERLETAKEKQRQEDIDGSDWGKARRLEAVEKELAELKAAQSQLSESRHD